MKIEMLDEKTVKVLLSKLDMNNYHLTYDEMDYRSPDTKKVLLRLLDEVKRQVKIDLSGGKLFIEAFPYVDGGCILYVNLLDARSTRDTVAQKSRTSIELPLIITVDGIKHLGPLCGQLKKRMGEIILKNELYRLDDKYCLLIYTYCRTDSELVRLAGEYSCKCTKGPIAAARVREHGSPLISEDAIAILDKSLN